MKFSRRNLICLVLVLLMSCDIDKKVAVVSYRENANFEVKAFLENQNITLQIDGKVVIDSERVFRDSSRFSEHSALLGYKLVFLFCERDPVQPLSPDFSCRLVIDEEDVAVIEFK